jgi:hypothetical protein
MAAEEGPSIIAVIVVRFRRLEAKEKGQERETQRSRQNIH